MERRPYHLNGLYLLGPVTADGRFCPQVQLKPSLDDWATRDHPLSSLQAMLLGYLQHGVVIARSLIDAQDLAAQIEEVCQVHRARRDGRFGAGKEAA